MDRDSIPLERRRTMHGMNATGLVALLLLSLSHLPVASSIQTGNLNGTGTAVTLATTHAVDRGNRITSIATQYQSQTPTSTPIIHDIAGNIASDGIYYYQYDAWNRLVQVNLLGEAVIGSDGRVESGEPKDVVARYAYDGLGRLIRKQSAVNTGETYIQSKDLYYDGVRRIQDVIFRPPVGSGLFEPEQGNDEGVIQPPEPEPTQVILGGDPGSVKGNVGYLWTDREYVYDPAGDVDAFICQIDKHNRVMYMLQDANLNVVGLVAGPSTANPSSHPWPAIGTLLEQYVYEPYGKVVKADSFYAHPVNRVGHQGLFFERYDAEFSHHTLAENALGLYYNRNRFYHPGLGRFTTRDPNETGMPILAALAMNGTALDVLFGGFNGQSLYGDGMNLFQYVNSNPVSRRDPSGLFSMLDITATTQYQLDMNGQTADIGMSLLELIAGIAGAVSYQHQMMGSMMGSGASMAGPDFDSMLAVVQGIQTYQNAQFARGIFKAGAAFARAGLGGLVRGGLNLIRKPGCFAAGTLILMSDGSTKAIEDIQPGDIVVCALDASHSTSLVLQLRIVRFSR